ncbi:MAG: methylenetetrahydrofolate reductase C-terminal domain-containing protein [Chloroflexi bacterium]|nr:methylenetetrahydrofolate reductase C-terminal domain-containing protein [Chloroflexota bacterium]
MIIGEQKPLDEIYDMVRKYREVLIVSCGTCVTVSFAGGEKEAETLASKLRIRARTQGHDRVFSTASAKRQCEWEFLDTVAAPIKGAKAVISIACGIGVQAIAEHFPGVHVVPGLNTSFLGMPVSQGVWEERCVACGDCILHHFGGLCPVARCSKVLLNGPCGGSVAGKCEISEDVPCIWQMIHDRLNTLGMVDNLDNIFPVRNWRTNNAAGPRRIIREDLKIPASPPAATSA